MEGTYLDADKWFNSNFTSKLLQIFALNILGKIWTTPLVLCTTKFYYNNIILFKRPLCYKIMKSIGTLWYLYILIPV